MNPCIRLTVPQGVRSPWAEGPGFKVSYSTDTGQGPRTFQSLLSTVVQEPDLALGERIGALCEAQEALRREVSRLAGAEPLDETALRQLGRSAHGLAEQTEVLLLRLVQSGAPTSLVALLDEIFDAFREAEAQVEAALARCRQAGRRLRSDRG